MEKVFWLMWLADIVGNIGIVGFACMVALVIGGGIIMAITGLEDGDAPEAFIRSMKVGKWLLIPLVVAVLTPSTKTVHVLAVASAADAAVNTALGEKGMQALNAVLDKVIENAKKP